MIVLNGLNAVIAAGFGVAALLAPGDLPGINGGVTGTAHFYAAMYAVRALPIAAAVLWFAFGDRRRFTPVLLIAGLCQLGDAIIGLAAGTPTMIAGPLVAAAIHLGSAWWISRPPAVVALAR